MCSYKFNILNVKILAFVNYSILNIHLANLIVGIIIFKRLKFDFLSLTF